jgi:ElaB/YqjD/DUF883 family membrane-anchored ribosome-binding protein
LLIFLAFYFASGVVLQAEVQKRQKDEEVSSLQSSLAKIIDEAGARTRREVDNVRKQFNDRVTKLTEEIHALEMV